MSNGPRSVLAVSPMAAVTLPDCASGLLAGSDWKVVIIQLPAVAFCPMVFSEVNSATTNAPPLSNDAPAAGPEKNVSVNHASCVASPATAAIRAVIVSLCRVPGNTELNGLPACAAANAGSRNMTSCVLSEPSTSLPSVTPMSSDLVGTKSASWLMTAVPRPGTSDG